MTCPHCHADNPDGALRCGSCGGVLIVVYEGQTLGSGPAAAAPAPAVEKPSAAAGVLSPPPGSGFGTPPLASAWPSAAESSLALEPGTEFGPRYRIESLIGKGGM